jgi:hypothetical protein
MTPLARAFGQDMAQHREVQVVLGTRDALRLHAVDGDRQQRLVRLESWPTRGGGARPGARRKFRI